VVDDFLRLAGQVDANRPQVDRRLTPI